VSMHFEQVIFDHTWSCWALTICVKWHQIHNLGSAKVVNIMSFLQAVCKLCLPKCLFDYTWSHCDLHLWTFHLDQCTFARKMHFQQVIFDCVWSCCALTIWPQNRFRTAPKAVNWMTFPQPVRELCLSKCLFHYTWSHCDLHLWPFDLEIWSVYLCPVPNCT